MKFSDSYRLTAGRLMLLLTRNCDIVIDVAVMTFVQTLFISMTLICMLFTLQCSP